MLEIFKNLKTLFFSYISIIVLLFFAVLQSNQAAYESSLIQLKEIEKLSELYDEKEIIELINNKLPDLNEKLEKKVLVGTLNLPIKITYQAADLDYSELKGRLEGKIPAGYNFGVGNQDRFPTDFTKVDSVLLWFNRVYPIYSNIF